MFFPSLEKQVPSDPTPESPDEKSKLTPRAPRSRKPLQTRVA